MELRSEDGKTNTFTVLDATFENGLTVKAGQTLQIQAGATVNGNITLEPGAQIIVVDANGNPIQSPSEQQIPKLTGAVTFGGHTYDFNESSPTLTGTDRVNATQYLFAQSNARAAVDNMKLSQFVGGDVQDMTVDGQNLPATPSVPNNAVYLPLVAR